MTVGPLCVQEASSRARVGAIGTVGRRFLVCRRPLGFRRIRPRRKSTCCHVSSRSAASREAVPTARTRKSPPVLARVSKILGLVARCVEQGGQFLKRVDAVFV